MWGFLIGLVSVGSVEIYAPEACDVSQLEALERRPNVTVTASISGAFDGHLLIRQQDRTFPERRVSAADCGEVARALALIARMAIARFPKVPAPPPQPRPPLMTRATERWALPPATSEAAWLIAVGAHGGVASGATPKIGLSAPIFVEVAQPSWALRITALWARGSERGLGVTFAAARLEGCPHRARWGSVELEPCATVEVGLVHGNGPEVVDSASRQSVWLAPGLLGRGRWRIGPRLFVEAQLAGALPLLRPRFFLAPDTTLWKSSALAVSASAGVGVTFW